MSPSEIKNIFQERGLSPKKWMGQNFLVDPNYLQKIVNAAEVRPGETVVEIGAGLGTLTAALAEAGAHVIAIEIDAGYARILAEVFANNPQVEIIHADALTYSFQEPADVHGRLRVVANLPYNVSGRLVFRFFEHRRLFESLHILLQKEPALRLTAQPGSKDFGILTALLGVTARVDVLFDAPPNAFFPAPKVTSSFVRVRFENFAELSDREVDTMVKLLKTVFNSRRKTMRNTLKQPVGDYTVEQIHTAADAAQIDLGRRPETLSPGEFARFARELIHAGEKDSARGEDGKDTERTP
jgi:16S rRNA (adenine1518-N6/adenine1519-N6)-dimethyltransferase